MPPSATNLPGKTKTLHLALLRSGELQSVSLRVIGKAEHTDKGSNHCYIITSLKGESKKNAGSIYCARGDMENLIKEQQLGLFANRT